MNNEYIIFIHRGVSWYLYHAVKQARFYHPKAKIAVITDEPQPQLSRYAEIHQIAHYWEGAAAFETIYEHYSPNSVAFELFCFQRWFVIREFLTRHKPDHAIHLDSDVLVYGNLFRDFSRLDGACLGIVGYQGPFSMLIPDVAIINQFCDRIIRLYSEEKDTLAQLYTEWSKVSAYVAVSDMHALHTFLSSQSLRALDLGVIHDHSVYDSVIHSSDGFRMREGIKEITWTHGEPWVHHEASGEAVRLKTIHCQGAAKCFMLDFFTARDIGYWRDKAVEKSKSLVKIRN